MSKFENVFDYLKWRGDLSFEERIFNEVDALILNMVSFLDFSNVIPHFPNLDKISIIEAVEKYFSSVDEDKLSLGLIIPNEMLDVAKIIITLPRYKDIYVSNFINVVNEVESKQFASLCFLIGENDMFISYKGTDDSLVGWVEDVNMLASFPIPAQRDSLIYLEKMSAMYENRNIYIGGHSKGGNLSVYSSVYANEKVQKMIKKVYSLDGPGFFNDTLDENLLNKIKDKIVHIIPNSGIVGRLFSLNIEPTIIKSNEKGLNQHNPFSWMIECDSFVKVESFTPQSNKIKIQVDELVNSMSENDRINFTDDLNKFILSLKQNNLLEFADMRNVISLIFNKYRMNHKNIRYLMKLYFIFSKNKALEVKIQK